MLTWVVYNYVRSYELVKDDGVNLKTKTLTPRVP